MSLGFKEITKFQRDNLLIQSSTCLFGWSIVNLPRRLLNKIISISYPVYYHQLTAQKRSGSWMSTFKINFLPKNPSSHHHLHLFSQYSSFNTIHTTPGKVWNSLEIFFLLKSDDISFLQLCNLTQSKPDKWAQ